MQKLTLQQTTGQWVVNLSIEKETNCIADFQFLFKKLQACNRHAQAQLEGFKKLTWETVAAFSDQAINDLCEYLIPQPFQNSGKLPHFHAIS